MCACVKALKEGESQHRFLAFFFIDRSVPLFLLSFGKCIVKNLTSSIKGAQPPKTLKMFTKKLIPLHDTSGTALIIPTPKNTSNYTTELYKDFVFV